MKNNIAKWLALIATLPTAGATPRMRLWRAIKTLGCAPLRDGVYLLPQRNNHASALMALADQTNIDGGQAWVVDITPQSKADEDAFILLFSRENEYREFVGRVDQARKALASLTPSDISKAVKRLRKEFESLQRIDFFPGEISATAQAALADFEEAANALLSPGEPHAHHRSIEQLNRADYQGRVWATRRHLWVDRVASAWLIRRFIDLDARFLWLDNPADCPKGVLGFDFNEATFTHIGDKVTFEVLLTSFGLDDDKGLTRLASLVHALDVGGLATPEATGFEAILSGARERLNDDDALLADISNVLDSLYIHFTKEPLA